MNQKPALELLRRILTELVAHPENLRIEYRALTALYQGDEAARQFKTAALTRRYEGGEARRTGKIQRSAARTKAGLTLLGGSLSFYDKYGDA